jgi:hypothetical protein
VWTTYGGGVYNLPTPSPPPSPPPLRQAPPAPAPGEEMVRVVLDGFESGTLDGWRVSGQAGVAAGSALGVAPFSGDNLAYVKAGCAAGAISKDFEVGGDAERVSLVFAFQCNDGDRAPNDYVTLCTGYNFEGYCQNFGEGWYYWYVRRIPATKEFTEKSKAAG